MRVYCSDPYGTLEMSSQGYNYELLKSNSTAENKFRKKVKVMF